MDLCRQRDFRAGTQGNGRIVRARCARADVQAALQSLLQQLDLFKADADADLAALLRHELQGAVDRYERLKAAHGALDFLDLLLRARDLLRNRAPRYRMYWTPDWENHELYEGRVLSSGLGRINVLEPAVWLEPGDEVQRLLREEALRVRFIAGPPTHGISPILSVHSAGIEFVMIGVLGDDFVYRYWARSDEARLDHANLQLADRFAPFEPGDTVALTFHFAESGYCLELNGVRECAPGLLWGIRGRC